MLEQYPPLTFIESHPVRGNTFFAQDKDNFFQFMTNIFRTPALPITNPSRYYKELHRINFHHYCQDETLVSLRDMDQSQLEQARIDLDHHIATMQPAIVVFVGTSLAAKHFAMKNQPTGLFHTQYFDNTNRTVTFFCLPSTRKSNRRNSRGQIESCVEALESQLQDFGYPLPLPSII